MLSVIDLQENFDAELFAKCEKMRKRALFNDNYQISNMPRRAFKRFDDTLATHICTHFGEHIGLYGRLYPHFLKPRNNAEFDGGVELQSLCLNAEMRCQAGSVTHFRHGLRLMLAKALRLCVLNSQTHLHIAMPIKRLILLREINFSEFDLEFSNSEYARISIAANEGILKHLGAEMPEPIIQTQTEGEETEDQIDEEVAA